MKQTNINIDEIKRFPTVTNPIKADDLHTPQAYAYTLRRAIVTDCNDRQRAELVELLDGRDTAEGVTFDNTREKHNRLHRWQNSEAQKERAAILGTDWQYIEGLHHGTQPGDLVTCIDGTRGRVTKASEESCVIEFETENGQRLSVAGYFRYTPSEKLETADERKTAGTMKRYTINCHYDMVISVDVIADNEQQAIEQAREQADRMNLNSCAECVGHSECVTDTEELTAGELRRMEREAVSEHVHNYIDWLATDNDLKEDLAGIAYRGDMINWPHGALCVPDGHPYAEWLENLFNTLAEGEHGCQELYDRYARMYARRTFETTYKRIDAPYYSAHVAGLSKEQQKAAFADGLRALVQTTIEQQEEGNEYVQMVTQFPTTMEHNALNLFTYFRAGGFVYSWQEIYEDEQGREQIDDYETREAEDVAAMIKAVFYNQDGESPYYDMQDIYVED